MSEDTPTVDSPEPSGGGAPFFDGGDFPGKAGLETASRQLNRVRDMIMERAGDAAEGVQNALRNFGGADGGPAVIVDPEMSQ